MAIVSTLNENESKVLSSIYRHCDSYEGNAIYFRTIEKDTGFETKVVRRACRSLAKKGLAEYRSGLFSEEGETAGSGYGITKVGESLGKDLGFEKLLEL